MEKIFRITAKKTFLITIVLFIFLFITNGVPFIYSDGYAAFHTANSIVTKGSFVSKEKPEHYDYKGHVIDVNAEGEYTVVYPPGTAVLNIPGQLIAQIFSSGKTIYNDYFMATNGHTLAEGYGFLVTASIFGLLTIYYLYKLLLELKISEKLSLFVTFVSFGSSYAIWYVMLSPSFNHTYELFGTTFALWSFLKYINTKASKYSFLSGIGIGIAVFCRPVLVVFGLPIFLYYASFVEKEIQNKLKNKANFQFTKFSHSLLPITHYLTGGFTFAILLMWYNFVSYGKFIASGYSESRGETFQFEEFNGLNILFSQYRGWFIYSPIFLLSIIGLLLLFRKNRFLSLYSLFSILSLVIIYGFWPTWWGGGSYGHRFMLPLLPFGAIGLAYLLKVIFNQNLSVLKYLTMFICIILTTYSLMLTLMYRFTPVAELRPKSDYIISGGRLMSSGDRYTPLNIIDYQIELVTSANGITDYINDLIDSGNGGNSIVPILLGLGNTTLRLDDRNQQLLKFLVIEPSIKRYELPSEIVFYAKDNLTGERMEGKFLDPGKNNIFILRNTDNGLQITDNNTELTLSINSESVLSKDKYIAVITNEGRYSFFFPKADKLFFKGPPIDLADGESLYAF